MIQLHPNIKCTYQDPLRGRAACVVYAANNPQYAGHDGIARAENGPTANLVNCEREDDDSSESDEADPSVPNGKGETSLLDETREEGVLKPCQLEEV
jgi:hypothetical protein